MFKNHPKGLLPAALSNMGERFGFYVMMAILLLFLDFKFGFQGSQGSIIYSVFYALIYVLALVGGLIADKTKKYKGTIAVGLVLMAVGYVLLAIPTPTPIPDASRVLILGLTCFGLFAIAFGNGLFKGNLQAVVGQLYDDPKYADKRETGFQIFYMFINIGAMFAPLMAVGLRNWWVQSHGFAFNSDLPRLSNQLLSGTITPEATTRFGELAGEVGYAGSDMASFAADYLGIFVTGYHYSFALAIAAMVISLGIFFETLLNLVYLLAAFFCLYIGFFGGKVVQVLCEVNQVSSAMEFLPMWVVNLCVPIFGLLAAKNYLHLFVLNLISKEERILTIPRDGE